MGNRLAGIDLGTTYSALAVLNDIGKPEIVPSSVDGWRIMPSVVAFTDAGEAIVGQSAKNQLTSSPEHVVARVKREMGNPGKTYEDVAFGKPYTPIEISAMILRKLKDDCTDQGEIKDVIITVPAAFDEVQRKSTMDAGTIAGLNVLGIVNEPTAAALYYSSISTVNGNILVYDLGGGTFDVTIIRMNGGQVDVVTSKGDVNLGGVDFDREILRIANKKYKEQTGQPLLPDEFLESFDETRLSHDEKVTLNHLMDLAESKKRALSKEDSQNFRYKGKSLPISRAEFEEAISDKIATTEMLIENALEDAKMTRNDIDKILLVGGSTRVPAVYKSVKAFFGKDPERAVNVDEAVALGAAIFAGMRKLEQGGNVSASIAQAVRKIALTEVCNRYFGTLAFGINEKTGEEELQNSIILKKNTPLPCTATETYYTMVDNQRSVSGEVTECEEETLDKDAVSIVGKIPIDLPAGLPKGSPLEHTYTYDKNQRLAISIKLPNGDRVKADISYSTSGVLMSPIEIERKKADMNDFVIE